MSELSVTTREDGPFTVLEAHGDVDLISAPLLRNGIESVLRESRRHLVVDLRDVPFLDSTGLGVLVGAQRAVRSAGGDIRLVCVEPRVLRVFSITGLDQVFSMFETPDAAVSEPPGLGSCSMS